MSKHREMKAVVLALFVIVAAGLFFFAVRAPEPADTIRVEEPYVRTEDLPPSAVEDETSAPALSEPAE
ncbi:hypothetical protein J5J10_15355 [Ciceribacter sp. L1K23]|uniref:hypothetical protein n=1 Tax=Ciceribacter sp. L1K23 TaxID=2820276 RepID=UPI001B836428|nr:hypothetical protein [Ciceribacter sp. L1K23]MBR0557064.1 hypothetical protein [Ciceribacter sp. L1K23]